MKPTAPVKARVDGLRYLKAPLKSPNEVEQSFIFQISKKKKKKKREKEEN